MKLSESANTNQKDRLFLKTNQHSRNPEKSDKTHIIILKNNLLYLEGSRSIRIKQEIVKQRAKMVIKMTNTANVKIEKEIGAKMAENYQEWKNTSRNF